MTIYLNALILIAAVAVVIDLVLLVAITKTFREKKQTSYYHKHHTQINDFLALDNE